MHAALSGDFLEHPLWPAFADTVRRFQIPAKLFDDAIDGQIQDLVTIVSFGAGLLVYARIVGTERLTG